MRLRLLLCLLPLMPALAEAEHECVDGYPMGAPIEIAKPLPDVWFKVGARDVRNKATHSALKQEHAAVYRSGYEEGPVGSLCLSLRIGYVEITTSDFGLGALYSESAPKCARCGPGTGVEEQFASGTGLRLGLTKSETSKLLKTKIIADLTDIKHEETKTVGGIKVLHTEVLSLEFKKGRLVRFSVYDYEESA